MKKNARYVGGSGTGVELTIPLTDNQQRRVTVAPGEALREDFGGVRVAPDFIVGLLETDDWEPATLAAGRAEQQTDTDQAELDKAAAAAAAEHNAAAEKAERAAAAATQKAQEHRAAGEQAAAAAVAVAQAEQQIRAAQKILDAKGGTS